MTQSTDAGMDVRIALIEKEFGIVHSIFQKFENALDKMSEATTLMQRVLAVHEQRIDERERTEKALVQSLERSRDESARSADRASQKMEEMANELRREIRQELTDLGDSVKSSLKDMKESHADIVKKIDEGTNKTETKIKDMEDRVRVLERWRWLMVGGGGVLGFILAKLPFIASLFSAVGSG